MSPLPRYNFVSSPELAQKEILDLKLGNEDEQDAASPILMSQPLRVSGKLPLLPTIKEESSLQISDIMKDHILQEKLEEIKKLQLKI